MFRYLRHGAIAGAAGGAGTALFLLLVGERSIADAIAIEEAAGKGGDAVFSRGVQQAGGALGALLFGAALGSVFAVVFAAVRHRLAGRDDFDRSLRLGGIAFVTVFLVPFLKYPANPPAVGDPSTAGRRTALYLVMLAWSVVSTWAAGRAARWSSTTGPPRPVPTAVAAGVWVALVGLGFTLLPGSPDRVAIPAALAWRFRVASAGGQAVLWAVTAFAFGWLRSSTGRRSEVGPLTEGRRS